MVETKTDFGKVDIFPLKGRVQDSACVEISEFLTLAGELQCAAVAANDFAEDWTLQAKQETSRQTRFLLKCML